MVVPGPLFFLPVSPWTLLSGAPDCGALIPGAKASRDALTCPARWEFPHRPQGRQQSPLLPAQLSLDKLASEALPAGSPVVFSTNSPFPPARSFCKSPSMLKALVVPFSAPSRGNF